MKVRIKRVLLYGINGGLILGIFIYMLMKVDFSSLMINFAQSYYNSFGELGVYISIFILSIFGNFTVILPTPYLLALLSVIIILPVNPIFVGLFAGAGAAIGESTAWLLGRGAREVAKVDKKKTMVSKNVEELNNMIKKGYGFPLVILFAVTPLPDDVLLIALGLANYSLIRTLIAMFIGKVIMTMSLAGFATLSKIFPPGQFILSLYGINVADGKIASSQNPFMSNVMTVATIAVIFLLFAVDWKSLLRKKA